MIVDRWYRHLVKTIIWRLMALLILGAIAYFMTDSFALTAYIAIADQVFKTALYYLYEHAWSKIDFGRELAGEINEHM